MSLIKSIMHQLGLSGDPAKNFTLSVPAAPDGTMKLARGNAGATTQDILTVRANGESVFHSPFGYALGGGSVTQLTDKTTTVILNAASGNIITASSALAAGQTVRFPFSNNKISLEDVLLVQRRDGGAGTSYRVWTDFCAAGQAGICIQNITGASLSEAVVLNFAIIKGAGA